MAQRNVKLDQAGAIAALREKFDEVRRGWKRPTILVAGYTGAGKTSLIRAICGPEIVAEGKVSHGRPGTTGFDHYETDLVRFYDSRGLEPGRDTGDFLGGIRKFVGEIQRKPSIDDHVHLAWYTIQGPGARVTDADLELIGKILPNVIVVLTKADITKPRQTAAIEAALADAGVARDRIVRVSEEDPASLLALLDLTMRLLPATYHDAFIAAQRIDLARKKAKSRTTIHLAAAGAAAAGATPLPFSDAFLITPIQIGMVAGIAATFDEPRATMQAALGPVVAEAVGVLTATSLLKFFPFLGSFVNAGIAYALTVAVGEITLRYMVSRHEARAAGQSMPTFEFDAAALKREFEAARKRAPA